MTDTSGVDLAKRAMEETPKLSCDEYRQMQDQEIEHILLDVREQDEYDQGHIENAMHIPRGMLEFQVEQKIPDKDATIVICCAKGGRAALAGQTLLELGYRKISYLEGGYSGYCD